MSTSADHPYALGWAHEIEPEARRQPEFTALLHTGVMFADDNRPLPEGFSLSRFRKWPFDQGQVGSCFANSATQCMQIHTAADNAAGACWEEVPLSRRFIWHEGRKLDGSLGYRGDGGSIGNSMRAQAQSGNPREATWSYKPEHSWLEQNPPQTVYTEAAQNKLTSVAAVQLGDAAKRCILNGHPCDIGIWWPYGWDSEIDSSGRTTGIGSGIFGHALAIIGWLDNWDGHTWWQIENSHGPIYRPIPEDVRSRVPGYAPAFADKTHDFWARDDMLKTVIGYGNAEVIAAAGMNGFKGRPQLLSWSQAFG